MNMDAICTYTFDVCPVCSFSYRLWRTKGTQYGDFAIVKCVECGFAFANPRPTSEFLREFYAKFGHGGGARESLDDVLKGEKAHPNSTLDAKRILNTIVRYLNPLPLNSPMRLLDVGCGYGFFSREARAQGFEVYALEPASAERTVAEKIAWVRPVPLSFEDFSDTDGSFVAILMSQILEHALDVNLWISKASRLLIPGGVLAVALPNFGSIFRMIFQEREPYICPPAHLNFFSPKSLALLLAKHGLQVRKVQWVTRLDPSAVFKRVPAIKFLGRCIDVPLRLALSSVDLLHLGMMVNIYAQKGSPEAGVPSNMSVRSNPYSTHQS